MGERTAEEAVTLLCHLMTAKHLRRVLRQIQEVLACQDGSEALVLCSDGGVFYCSPLRDVFVELTDLQFPYGTNSTWSLRRVGADGQLLLVQAIKTSGQSELKVVVNPLQGFCTNPVAYLR